MFDERGPMFSEQARCFLCAFRYLRSGSRYSMYEVRRFMCENRCLMYSCNMFNPHEMWLPLGKMAPITHLLNPTHNLNLLIRF